MELHCESTVGGNICGYTEGLYNVGRTILNLFVSRLSSIHSYVVVISVNDTSLYKVTQQIFDTIMLRLIHCLLIHLRIRSLNAGQALRLTM